MPGKRTRGAKIRVEEDGSFKGRKKVYDPDTGRFRPELRAFHRAKAKLFRV